MHIFNGIKLASEREKLLKEKVASDSFGKKLKIAAILFVEDVGSQLYTNLKHEAADRVGIEYEVHKFSLTDVSDGLANQAIITKIEELNNDSSVTGIIIQKPWRKTWVKAQKIKSNYTLKEEDASKSRSERQQYNAWWENLTSKIAEEKDVDGLHPNTIEQIKLGTWQENGKVLPATCKAVLTIIDRAEEQRTISEEKIIIIGKSDLLGKPLYYELLRRGHIVELIASKELKERMQSGEKLLDASMIVSATGRKNLITGDMISDNIIVIDVGEPNPDVEFESVSSKASFITPVPGGVGPMTVISLLENCANIASNRIV